MSVLSLFYIPSLIFLLSVLLFSFQGHTALTYSSLKGNATLVQMLLKGGADPRIKAKVRLPVHYVSLLLALSHSVRIAFSSSSSGKKRS
jgi:ankyrin repeat protein